MINLVYVKIPEGCETEWRRDQNLPVFGTSSDFQKKNFDIPDKIKKISIFSK